MLQNVKIKFDGNHVIGSLPSTRRLSYKGRTEKTKEAELFDVYYKQALEEGVKDKKLCGYIQDRFLQEQDIEDWISEEKVRELYKNKIRNKHKRIKRYRDKLFIVEWNYYVTFTYDDKKETEESFMKRLKKVFSNFKVRHNWLVIAVPEEGEQNGRRHVHAFIYIPEGEMQGELFTNKLWSKKKRRWTYFTDNTYFARRFGHSVWKPINRNDLSGNGLSKYLEKYLEKSGNRFFYSRGIPSEIDMVIDTETDVFCTFCNYGMKVMLYDHIFFGADRFADIDLSSILSFSESEIHGYNLDDYPIVA